MSVLPEYFTTFLPQALRDQGREPLHARPVQMAYAQAVESALDAGYAERDAQIPRCVVTALVGGAGVGKTYGFGLAALDRLAQHRKSGEAFQPRLGIATYTISLREQIAGDMPLLIAAIKARYPEVTLTWAQAFGSQQYLSRHRVAEIFSQGGIRSTAAAAILACLQEHPDLALIHEIREMMGLEEDSPLIPGLTDEQLGCSWKEAKTYPAYRAMRQQVKTADIVLMSHVAALINARAWFGLLDAQNDPQSLRAVRYMIFDEAHKLPEAAKTLTRMSVSCATLTRLLADLHEVFTVDAPVMTALGTKIAEVETQLQSLRPETKPGHEAALALEERLETGAQKGRLVKEMIPHESLGYILTGFRNLIESHVTPTDSGAATPLPLFRETDTAQDAQWQEDAYAVLTECATVIDRLETFLSLYHKNPYDLRGVIAWSPVKGDPSIQTTPNNPGALVARYWRHYPGKGRFAQARGSRLLAAVLTSATLPPLERLGIFAGVAEPTADTVAWQVPPLFRLDHKKPFVFEPKPYGTLSFVLSGSSPKPTLSAREIQALTQSWQPPTSYINPAWKQHHWLPLVRQVLAHHKAGTGKGVLILTRSHADGVDLKRHFPGAAYGLIVQGKGMTLSQAAREYRRALAEKRPAVLVSAGGWEGLDLPGLVGDLILMRLPNLPPDPVEKRILALRQAGKAFTEEALLRLYNNTYVRMAMTQALGRAIRGEHDSATVWVADNRFGVPADLTGHMDARLGDTAIPQHLRDAVPSRFHPALDRNQVRFFTADHGVFSVKVGAAKGAVLFDDLTALMSLP